MRLARRTYEPAVVDATSRRITLQLHPAASPATIVVLPDGDLDVRAETSNVGPGYHTSLFAEIGKLLEEIDYTWETAVPTHADTQRRMAAWFAEQLRAGATKLGMPTDRSFRLDAAICTAMGPRDLAWRDRVLADPMASADAFSWWDDEPGHDQRSMALHLMWHEVPWREPIDDDEKALLSTVMSHLWAAERLNPRLSLPHPEVADLYEWLGMADEAAKERKRARGRTSTIGYRRFAMEIELSGGWTIVLPGSFVAHWADEGTRWWSSDGERAVEMTSLTVPDATDSAALLAVAPEVHPVRERFVDGERHGRIEAHDEGAIHIMHGLVAKSPHVAFLTCKSRDPDEAWAIAAWRSLMNET